MRVLPFLIPFVLAACTGGDTAVPASTPLADPTVDFGIVPPPVDTDWPETDADTDADTDSDTDADTDTDTQVDTDTDIVDTDTGIVDTDTNPPCELTFLVEVRDAGGTVCGTTNCDTTESISVVAIAKNECTTDLATPGTNDCFAVDWTVEEATSPTPDVHTASPCTGTLLLVTAGQQVEQSFAFPAMTAADYIGKVTFADTAATVVSSPFTVVQAPL